MSTTISDLKSKAFYQLDVNNASKPQSGQKTDNFSDIFDKTQGSGQEYQTKTESKVKKEDSDSIQNHANIQKNKASENVKEKTEEVESPKSLEEMEKDAQEAADTVVKEIADTFDVTVEEVERVLESLGLTAMDLLNVENLTDVVLALNPDCDAMTLMTNEELYADLKGLMGIVSELNQQLSQKFGMSEEDLNRMLESMKDVLQTENLVETQEAEFESVSFEENVVEIIPDVVEEQPEVIKTTKEENKETKSTQVQQTESGNSQAKETQTIEPQKEAQLSGDAKEDSSGNKSENYNNTPVQNFLNQLAEAVDDVNQTTYSYGVRGQDIVNQITEQIRIHVTQETTEMELQLHPASLGNVKVQIASTGGVLTAVFTTENEAVKAALEAQLVQLKENFTEQGLKVESVEVNVSAQGFERSLDQQEQEQNRFTNGQNKKSGRRIRLNGVEEAGDVLPEEMSGDDRIVADMMLRNGNSVDFMV